MYYVVTTESKWPQGLTVGLTCRHIQAAVQGDLQVLQAAWEQAGRSWHSQAWNRSAGSDHLNQTWAKNLCAAAALGGHLALLQWLHQHGCGWDRHTCSGAARGGHLAILQWARQNDCSWGKDTCSNAARGGHLAVLQWARQSGCKWGKGTCCGAARGGHLAVLQWARQNGCGWGTDTCSNGM